MQGTHDVELAVRWLQFGVLSPINRLHSSMNPFSSKEPWAYGEPAATIMRRYMRLRHRLIPTLYTAAWAAHAANVSVVRPMYHDASREHGAYTHPNQYLLDEHLLVVPITAPLEQSSHLATARAWLPVGERVDVFSGLRYRGSREVTLARTLEAYPVLARAGAVVPLDADPMSHAGDAPTELELLVIPGTGESTLAEDDGSAAPERGLVTFRQSLEVREGGGADITLTISASGAPLPDRRIDPSAGVQDAEDVSVDGGVYASFASLPADAENLSPAGLSVDLGVVRLSEGLTIRICGARPAEAFDAQRVFELLQQAELAFEVKRQVWVAVEENRLLDALSVELPRELHDALSEQLAAVVAW